MSDKSQIEWTDATWSPVTGCTKVSQGCKNCYAEREVETRWSKNPKSVWYGRAFTDVRCHPEALNQPLHWKKGRRIFVCPRADLFHAHVPDKFIAQVFAVMAKCPQHTFQVLTKRAERMQFLLRSEWDWKPPYNIWMGVSIEDQDTADERVPLLLDTPGAVRWISAEPLLGPIDLRLMRSAPLWAGEGSGCAIHSSERFGLSWVVVGGESGKTARPMHPDWARSLRDQCAAARVSFLFKQHGAWAPACDYYSDEDSARDAALDRPHLLITTRGNEWHVDFDGQPPIGTWIMHRTGKKAAGRLLDGVLHDAYPEA